MSFLSFDELFFSNNNDLNKQDLISKSENNKKPQGRYNTRDGRKNETGDPSNNNSEVSQEEVKPAGTSLDSLFDDIFGSFDVDDDFNKKANNDISDIDAGELSRSLEPQVQALESKMNISKMEDDDDDKSCDVEITVADQQQTEPDQQQIEPDQQQIEPEQQIDKNTNNNNNGTNSGSSNGGNDNNNDKVSPPKRHSLRKRQDIQLHPYSVEKAKYMSLLRRTPKSRATWDRLDDYINSSQYPLLQEQQGQQGQDDIIDDPDFIPGQSIPTQDESVIQETQEPEWDSNVLFLPNLRPSKQNSTKYNLRDSNENMKRNSHSLVESLLDKEKSAALIPPPSSSSSSSSKRNLQTDPISSLPLLNNKPNHRIIHTYARKNKRYRQLSTKSVSSATETTSNDIFDFDPNPHVFQANYSDTFDDNEYGDYDNGDINYTSNNEEEDDGMLPKKRLKKRRVIISDSDEEEDEEDSDDEPLGTVTATTIRRNRKGKEREIGRKSLLDANSVKQFNDMANSSSSSIQVQPRRIQHRRQRSDEDIVPIVQDENELGMNESRRVRLDEISKNKRLLRGILPLSFTNVYRSELQEEQEIRRAKKPTRVKRRPVQEPVVVESTARLHTLVDLFSSDSEDDNEQENTSQKISSSLFTMSQSSGRLSEAEEYDRPSGYSFRESKNNSKRNHNKRTIQTRLNLPQKSRKTSGIAIEYNKPSHHYQRGREVKKALSSNSQLPTRKKQRRKIHKTTDDLYIRSATATRYWNDETIDRMFTRQRLQPNHYHHHHHHHHHQQQQQQQQQQKRAYDDMSIGSSFTSSSNIITSIYHGARVKWVYNVADFLKNQKNNHAVNMTNHSSSSVNTLVDPLELLSRTYNSNNHKRDIATIASILEKVGDLVDPDLRSTIGLPNTVYLHHKLLPSLLSAERNQKKCFQRWKSLLDHPVIHDTQISWKDIVPSKQKLIRGWFWKSFYDIANTFQNGNNQEIDPTFYLFVSVCLSQWISKLPGDDQIALLKIFNNEIQILAQQIYDFVMLNMDQFIPWKVVIQAMLFILDWKCRLCHLGADQGNWSVTDLTSILVHLLVQIGPERVNQEATSYVTEAWICLLQIMSVSTADDGYYYSEQIFLEQLEKWVDDRASKETWSNSFKTLSMFKWALSFEHIFEKYML